MKLFNKVEEEEDEVLEKFQLVYEKGPLFWLRKPEENKRFEIKGAGRISRIWNKNKRNKSKSWFYWKRDQTYTVDRNGSIITVNQKSKFLSNTIIELDAQPQEVDNLFSTQYM